MAEDIFVKVGGVQRTIDQPFVKVGGVWRTVSDVWVKVGGVWRHSWPPPAPNNPPTVAVQLANQASIVGTADSYTFAAGSFADADGDDLTYTASGLPPGVTFTSATRTFSGTPTTVGTYNVTVTANDGNGGTVSDTFQWSVTATALDTPFTMYSNDNGVTTDPYTTTFSNLGGFLRAGTRNVYNGPNFTGGQTPYDPFYNSGLTHSITGTDFERGPRFPIYLTGFTQSGLTTRIYPNAIASIVDLGADARYTVHMNLANPAIGHTIMMEGIRSSDTAGTVVTKPAGDDGTDVPGIGLLANGSTFTVQADRSLRVTGNYYIGQTGARVDEDTLAFTKFIVPAGWGWPVGSVWTKQAIVAGEYYAMYRRTA